MTLSEEFNSLAVGNTAKFTHTRPHLYLPLNTSLKKEDGIAKRIIVSLQMDRHVFHHKIVLRFVLKSLNTPYHFLKIK